MYARLAEFEYLKEGTRHTVTVYLLDTPVLSLDFLARPLVSDRTYRATLRRTCAQMHW